MYSSRLESPVALLSKGEKNMTFIEGLIFICMLALFPIGIGIQLHYWKTPNVKTVVTGFVFLLTGTVLTNLQSNPHVTLIGVLGVAVLTIIMFIVSTIVMVNIVKDAK